MAAHTRVIFWLAALLLVLPFASQVNAQQTAFGFYVEEECDRINFKRDNALICIQHTASPARPVGAYRWTGTEWLKADGAFVATTAPPLCRRGDLWHDSDGTAGNLSVCGPSNTWTTLSGTGTSTGGHVFRDEGGAPLTQRTDVNCVGGGITCADVGGMTEINVPPGAVNVASNYTWTGIHSWLDGNFSILNTADPTKIMKFSLTGQTASTTRTYTLPDASTRLIGDSDFSTLGCMARTATTPTYAGVTLTGTANRVTITNGNCIGTPTFNVGSLVVQTDQGNIWSTGDQNMAAAASLTVPTQTGAAPTASGRLAFDSTAAIPSQSYKVGIGGANWSVGLVNGNLGTFTGTFTGTAPSYQPLDADLTQLAAIPGGINRMPIHNGTIWTFSLVTNCNGANDAVTYDNVTQTWGCHIPAGGLTGGTVGTLPKYASVGTPSTLTQSLISESGSVVTINATTIQQGTCAPFCLTETTTLTADRARTRKDADGNEVVSTGVLVAGNLLTTNAQGVVIDGGAAAGLTASSVATLTNKTLVDLGTGDATGNAITTPIFASFDGGALTPDGTNCTDPTKQTINSGPTQYAFVCPTPNSAIFDAALFGIKNAVTTFRIRLKANDTASATALAGTFKAQCRASGTAPSSTWGSTQTVSITLTTANNTYEGLTAAITPNGTCSAGADLYIRYNATGGGNSATTRILGLGLEQLS